MLGATLACIQKDNVTAEQLHDTSADELANEGAIDTASAVNCMSKLDLLIKRFRQEVGSQRQCVPQVISCSNIAAAAGA